MNSSLVKIDNQTVIKALNNFNKIREVVKKRVNNAWDDVKKAHDISYPSRWYRKQKTKQQLIAEATMFKSDAVALLQMGYLSLAGIHERVDLWYEEYGTIKCLISSGGTVLYLDECCARFVGLYKDVDMGEYE